MKTKILLVLSLVASVWLVGCRGDSGANANVKTNMNTNTAMATPTPVMQTNESAAADPAMKSKVEAALKAKGFTDVTVDATTSPMTLRGTVASKEKMAEAVQTAQEAAGKPVKNEITEKK